jgi:hypothetical protein
MGTVVYRQLDEIETVSTALLEEIEAAGSAGRIEGATLVIYNPRHLWDAYRIPLRESYERC